MINVSFTDLASIAERPLARGAARPMDAAGFAALIDSHEPREPSADPRPAVSREPVARPPQDPAQPAEPPHPLDKSPTASNSTAELSHSDKPVAKSRQTEAAPSDPSTNSEADSPKATDQAARADTPSLRSEPPADQTAHPSPQASAAIIENPASASAMAFGLDVALANLTGESGSAIPAVPAVASAAGSPATPAVPAAPATPALPAVPATSADPASQSKATPPVPPLGTGNKPLDAPVGANPPAKPAQPDSNAASAADIGAPAAQSAREAASVANKAQTAVDIPIAPKGTAQPEPSARPSFDAPPAERSTAHAATPRDSLDVSPSAAATVSQAASRTVSRIADFTEALGGKGIEISFGEAPVAPTRPAPVLANGMLAQFSRLQSMETPAQPGLSGDPALLAADDGTASSNGVALQTAGSAAANPAPAASGHDAQPKFAVADGIPMPGSATTASPHGAAPSAVGLTAAAKLPAAPPSVPDQIAVQFAKAAAEGIDKFNIKLKPATLGQIEVQLEIAADGRVHAVIAADRPETLDLLQRDSRALERALGDTGLRIDSGSLSFNLRGQGQQQDDARSFGGFGGNPPANAPENLVPGMAQRIGAYLNSRAAAGGVDIRV